MALALNTTNAAFWVTDEDLAELSDGTISQPDADVAFLVRTCGPDDYRELKRDMVTYVFDRKTHQKVEKDLTPEQSTELGYRVFEHMLVDWRGVVDRSTQAPVPCTSDAKRAFAEQDSARLNAIRNAVSTLKTAETDARGRSFRATPVVGPVVE